MLGKKAVWSGLTEQAVERERLSMTKMTCDGDLTLGNGDGGAMDVGVAIGCIL